MRVAVASGKGGTGKTTVAVSLALALAETQPVQLLDCDVEEPNVHLFVRPEIAATRSVDKLLPRVSEAVCQRCGACVRACEFHALGLLGDHILAFPELCHGCGRCVLVCPHGAIDEVAHSLGTVETGTARGLLYGQGTLNVGEAMATPIIRELKREIRPEFTVVLDAPPGTGCPAIAVLRGVDVALLVTEPTSFGLHDLAAAVGVARTLDVPVAVILNRAGVGDDRVEAYCADEEIPLLMKIPFDRAIAASYAVGTPLVDALPEWRGGFAALGKRLEAVMAG